MSRIEGGARQLVQSMVKFLIIAVITSSVFSTLNDYAVSLNLCQIVFNVNIGMWNN